MFIYSFLVLDICCQERYIPPKTQIDLNILCNESRLLLLSKDNNEYIVKIRNANLQLTRIALFPDITNTFLSVYQKEDCQYFLQGSYFKSWAVQKGCSSITLDDAYPSGILPTYSVLFLCESASLNSGTLKSNPYYHPHCNISSISYTVNGNTTEIHVDFSKKKYVRLYLDFLKTVGSHTIPNSAINYETYAEGLSFFCLNYSQHANDNIIPQVMHGNAIVTINFRENIKANYNLVMYNSIPQKLTISSDRTVNLSPTLT